MSQSQTYQVRGMTCEHCVHAVTAELEALDTVTGVAVELVPQGNSQVAVSGAVEVAPGAVRDAVERAGYELVGAASH